MTTVHEGHDLTLKVVTYDCTHGVDNVYRGDQYPINAHIWRQLQSIQNLPSDPSPHMLRDLGMVTLAVISNVRLVLSNLKLALLIHI
jgi:hypothetical protein